MGFNNGYDAGYDDAILAARDGRIPGLTGSKLLMKVLKCPVHQLVHSTSEAVLNTNDYPLLFVVRGRFIISPTQKIGMVLCCIPPGQMDITNTPWSSGTPGTLYPKRGLYLPHSDETSPIVEWGALSFDGIRRATTASQSSPTITSAKTRGESEGSVNIAGGILDVVGQNLETATAVELWSDGATPALWQTVPATYADGKLTTGELDYDEAPSDGGTVRVTTAGGTASYDITYCAH